MARKVNFSKRGEKIKELIDELVNEITSDKVVDEPIGRKLRLSEIDFEDQDLNTLIQVQARLSRLILDKSR